MKTTEILARLADERRRVNPASAFDGPRPSDEFRAGIFADLLAAEDFHHLTSGTRSLRTASTFTGAKTPARPVAAWRRLSRKGHPFVRCWRGPGRQFARAAR